MRGVIFFITILSVCFIISFGYAQTFSQDSPAIDKVKCLQSSSGLSLETAANNLRSHEWFSIIMLNKNKERTSELVCLVDTTSKMNLLYIWFVDSQDKVYYANSLAKRLTPFLKKAEKIDEEWANNFCKKEFIKSKQRDD